MNGKNEGKKMRRNLHAGKRSSGGFNLNMLSDDELHEIHLATLEVLKETGLFVEDESALDVFEGAGAMVDRDNKIVRFHPFMIEEAIDSAPSKIFLAGRNPEHDFVMEGNRVGFTNFGEGIKIVDIDTGEIRPTTKRDVAMTARMVDAMDEIDVNLRAVGAHDVDQAVAPLHNAEVLLANTTKHCFIGPISGFLVKKLAEMAAAVAGGMDALRRRPLLSFNTCPVSPLKLVRDTCEIIMEGARHGLAVNVLSMAIYGSTGTCFFAFHTSSAARRWPLCRYSLLFTRHSCICSAGHATYDLATFYVLWCHSDVRCPNSA